MITLDEPMSLPQGNSLGRRKRTPRQKVPGINFAHPPVRNNACPPVRVTNVELGVVLLKPPQPRLDPQKNQNGTMAKDALLQETFISAECGVS